jgi:hypothetical protein
MTKEERTLAVVADLLDTVQGLVGGVMHNPLGAKLYDVRCEIEDIREDLKDRNSRSVE